MKVHVNSEICAGFGICLGIAPEVFELHDDGYAVVLVSEVSPEDRGYDAPGGKPVPGAGDFH